jgi:hypothetical protein
VGFNGAKNSLGGRIRRPRPFPGNERDKRRYTRHLSDRIDRTREVVDAEGGRARGEGIVREGQSFAVGLNPVPYDIECEDPARDVECDNFREPAGEPPDPDAMSRLTSVIVASSMDYTLVRYLGRREELNFARILRRKR